MTHWWFFFNLLIFIFEKLLLSFFPAYRLPENFGSRYILRRPCRPVINAGGRRCWAARECGCCDMSIFLNSHTRLLSAQLQLQWSVEQTINVYPPCHQSQRRRVLAALITTADGAGHPKSAALITGQQGRQRRRSIYRDRKTLPVLAPHVFKIGALRNAYLSCITTALLHFSVHFTHYSTIYVKMSTYLQFHITSYSIKD